MRKVLLGFVLVITMMSCSKEEIPVVEIDTTAPVITLIGDAVTTVKIYTVYIDAGATAMDNVDGDLTLDIVSTSRVDIKVLGTYDVIYRVSDEAGNVGEAVRIVSVIK